MSIVNTTQPTTAAACQEMLQALTRAYPVCRSEKLTTTAFQRPIHALVIGTGPRRVLFTGAHHGNEWITATLLLKFAQELAVAVTRNGQLGGQDGTALAEAVTIYIVPMVDPDGVDLVTGAIAPGSPQYLLAEQIGRNYPSIAFPDGWKANLLGVDLNLNYPAGWLQARQIKFAQGYTGPAPRDYVGRAPLDQPETHALAEYTRQVDPALVLAFHTQGQEIYWQFKEYDIPGARELGERMARASGYTLAQTPYNSSFAGYKDWFIQEFRRPGYTVEAGKGTNPLPITQFDEIYAANLPLMLIAARG